MLFLRSIPIIVAIKTDMWTLAKIHWLVRYVARLTKLKLLNEKNLLWFSIELKWIQVYFSTHKIQEHFNGLGTKTTTSIEIHNLRVRSKAKCVSKKPLFLCGFWHDKKITKIVVKKKATKRATTTPHSTKK